MLCEVEAAAEVGVQGIFAVAAGVAAAEQEGEEGGPRVELDLLGGGEDVAALV